MKPTTDPRPNTTHVVPLPERVGGVEGLRRLAASLAQLPQSPGTLRIEQAVEDVDPLTWLAGAPEAARFFFGARDGGLVVAGLGQALVVDGDNGAADDWLAGFLHDEDARGLHVFTTCRFDAASVADSEWAPFGPLRLVLARVELARSDAGATIAVHIVEDGRSHADQVADATRILTALGSAATAAESFSAELTEETPDADGWSDAVGATLADIQAGRLDKCVLARSRTYALDGGVDPFALLLALRREQPGTFGFGVQVEPGRAFVGATPELLFQRREREVQSDALAGTRRRSPDESEDAQLAADLLASEKDQNEHAFVTAHVTAALRPLLDGVAEVDGPTVRRLAGIQHLGTHIRGRLLEGVTDLALLRALHPTPAVCGVPAEAARTTIRGRERFDRGLYGGAVGVIGRNETVMAVGIRSALLSGDRITLLAGAGIVTGSDPEAEWEETGDKMRGLDAILRAGHAG